MARTLPTFDAFAVPRAGVGLNPWPVTTEELESSEMHGAVLWRSADGTRAPGVWHATPGTIRGTFLTDEVSYVVEGRLTVVTPHDGGRREVAAGDVMVMEAGLSVEWLIHEPMTKLWNLIRAGRSSLLTSPVSWITCPAQQ